MIKTSSTGDWTWPSAQIQTLRATTATKSPWQKIFKLTKTKMETKVSLEIRDRQTL